MSGRAGQGVSKVYQQRHDRYEPYYFYRWDVLFYKGQCNQDCDINVNRNGIPRACLYHLPLADVESCLSESKLV